MNVRALGVVCALGLVGVNPAVRAEQVNSAATIMHGDDVSGGAVRYIGNSVINWDSGTITLFGAIPRVPGGGAVTVFVDGESIVGMYRCTVTSGFASKSFTVSSPPTRWTRSVNFAAAEAPSSAYFSLSCSLPMDGQLTGVTITG